MKNKFKLTITIAVAIIVFIIASEIFSDWEHFKTGLFGHPPVKEIQK